MTQKRIARISLTVLSLLIILFFMLPLIWLVSSSFRSPHDIFTTELRVIVQPTAMNYREVLRSVFPRRLLNSTVISLATVMLTVPAGLLAAYAISRFKFKGRDPFFFFLLTTAMAPPVAFVVPIFMLFRRLHLLDTHIGLIAVYVLFNIGFCVWLLRGFVDDVPREVEEAALVDGCSPWRVLFTITTPIIASGVVTAAILVFIFSWNEFLFASLLTRAAAATFTTHLVTFFDGRRVLWGELTAAASIGTLVPMALAFTIRRYMVRGMTFGSVKG